MKKNILSIMIGTWLILMLYGVSHGHHPWPSGKFAFGDIILFGFIFSFFLFPLLNVAEVILTRYYEKKDRGDLS